MGNFDLNQTYDTGNKYERLETLNINKELLNCGNAHSLDVIKPISDSYIYNYEIINDTQNLIINLNSEHLHWGFKDPRSCLTYSFWQEYLPRHQLIFVYRHPLEVWRHYHKYINNKMDYSETKKIKIKILGAWMAYNTQILKIIANIKTKYYCINFTNFLNINNKILEFENFVGLPLNDCRDLNLYRSKVVQDPSYIKIRDKHFPKIEKIYELLENIRFKHNE